MSKGEQAMTTEAERLASVFETFAEDHKPTGYPAVQQHFLSDAASVLREQAAEIERLKSTPPAQREDLYCVIADLTRQCQESDALLRQALEALEESRDDVETCLVTAWSDRHDKRIAFYKEQLINHDAAVATIKQHLGEDHGD